MPSRPGLKVLLLASAFALGCEARSQLGVDGGASAAAPAAPTGALSALPPAGPSVTPVPPDLLNAEIYAGNVYLAVDAGKWARATRELPDLEQAVREFRRETLGQSEDVQLLDETVERLRAAVAGQERIDALRAANEATLITTNLAEPYAPLVPPDVDRLGYYGRALQILAESNDRAKLTAEAAELARTWAGVKPFVVQHAGVALAERFEASVRALEKEQEPSRLEDLASAELDELRVVRHAITDTPRALR